MDLVRKRIDRNRDMTSGYVDEIIRSNRFNWHWLSVFYHFFSTSQRNRGICHQISPSISLPSISIRVFAHILLMQIWPDRQNERHENIIPRAKPKKLDKSVQIQMHHAIIWFMERKKKLCLFHHCREKCQRQAAHWQIYISNKTTWVKKNKTAFLCVSHATRPKRDTYCFEP